MTIQFMVGSRKTQRKRAVIENLAILGACIITLVTGTSCHRGPTETANTIDTGNPKAAAERVAEADNLYAHRADLGQARQAVSVLRQARVEDFGDYGVAWKLARADYYVGEHTDNDRERDASFREGTEAGKKAVELQGGKPEGHFWLGANYGGAAKYSLIAGLSSIEDIQKEMDAVLKIDPSFQAGSAYMVLGQLYLEAPGMLGGNKQKAIEYLEKGLRYGSENALLRLNLAQAYHAVNRDPDARKQIDYIMSMKIAPAYEPEYKDAVEQAKKLLAELKS